MLLPVDDDGGDLLVHEEEDGEEEGGDAGQKVDVPEFSRFRWSLCYYGEENIIDDFLEPNLVEVNTKARRDLS